jgi:hypothetical protein
VSFRIGNEVNFYWSYFSCQGLSHKYFVINSTFESRIKKRVQLLTGSTIVGETVS